VGAMLDVSNSSISPPKPKDGLDGAPSFSRAAEAFRSFKGDVENLLEPFAYSEMSFDRETAGYFHQGRSARVLMDGAVVAQFGQIAEEVKAQRKLRQDVFLAEIDLELLRGRGLRMVKYAPLGKYPAVERDFSFVCGDAARGDGAAVGSAARVQAGGDFSWRIDWRGQVFDSAAGAVAVG